MGVCSFPSLGVLYWGFSLLGCRCSPDYAGLVDRMASPPDTLAVSIEPRLTPFPVQWEIFCAEVALGSPAVQAAVKAGYSPDYADRLAGRPEIVDRVNRLLEEKIAGGGVSSRLWAELRLMQIAEDCLVSEPAKLSSDGNELIPARVPQYQVAISAINSVAKIRGWIVERKQTLNGRVDLGSAGESLESALGALNPVERSRIEDMLGQSSRPGPGRRRARRSAVPGSQIVDVPPIGPSDQD